MKKAILSLAAAAVFVPTLAFAQTCGERIAAVVCNPASPNHLILEANRSCALEYQNSGFIEATVGDYTFRKNDFGPVCINNAVTPFPACASTTGRSTSVPLHAQPVYTIFRDTAYSVSNCEPLPPPT